MHVNFSTKEMREVGGRDLIEGICDTLSFYHEEHINNYGSDNEKRLTGLHETQSIENLVMVFPIEVLVLESGFHSSK